jgi:hypothetical protein
MGTAAAGNVGVPTRLGIDRSLPENHWHVGEPFDMSPLRRALDENYQDGLAPPTREKP